MDKRDAEHQIANAITGHFEGGQPGSINTYDKGIVSYGKHQATLASGLLGQVLDEYAAHSTTQTAGDLRQYADRVHARDPELKKDAAFLGLLASAAREDAMSRAQDAVFTRQVWQPAVARADRAGMTSPLGHVLAYDTANQHGPGGLDQIIARTTRELHGKIGDVAGTTTITEAAFIGEFMNQREKLLLEIATRQQAKHDPTTVRNGKVLEADAHTGRIPHLKALVATGDLELNGDKDGFVSVPGTKIRTPGVALQMTGAPAPQVAQVPDAGPPPPPPPPPPTNARPTRTGVDGGALRGPFDIGGVAKDVAVEYDRDGKATKVIAFERGTPGLRVPHEIVAPDGSVRTNALFTATAEVVPGDAIRATSDRAGNCVCTNTTQGVQTRVSPAGDLQRNALEIADARSFSR